MLHVVIGQHSDYILSLTQAIDAFNAIEGQKTFHHKESCMFDNVWFTELWFSVRQITPSQPEHQFIGSVGINPNDPNWRNKLSI